VFARAVDAILAQLDPLLDRPLREVMWGGDADLIDQTGWAQPALFMVEAALFEVLGAYGITPDYLLGHSIGEVTAAYVAGVWSLRDACHVVAARARLMQALPAGGAMAALQTPEDQIADLLPAGVSIAAVNTPDSVVVSGPQDLVDQVVEQVSARGHRVSRLRVSHAFHSALMDPMLDYFRAVLESVQFGDPRIPVVSNLTGRLASAEELCSPEYWVRQVRETVRFCDGVRQLADENVTALVELGPDGVLSALAQHSCAPGTVVVPVLRRPRADDTEVPPSDTGTLLSALAQVFAQGAPVDWTAAFEGRSARRIPLPTYAFQRDRFWPEPVLAASQTTKSPADAAVDGWRYRETWKPLVDLPSTTPSGRWLVVLPQGESEDPWAAGLIRALGPDTLTLEFDRIHHAALAERLTELTADIELAGVASLATELDSVLILLKGLSDAAISARLWAVTRGAVSTGRHDPVVDTRQGALWGLGRVAALEQPAAWGGLIDLPEAVDARVGRWLASAISNTSGEDQIAIRSSGPYGRRLTHSPATADGEASWSTSGTALVTGGTGGLGGFVARWLAARGAQHIVLASRRGPNAEGADELRSDLESAGAAVTVVACDVADRAALNAVMANIPEQWPLRTVVHAAGVAGEEARTLADLTPEHLADLTRAKLDGARHLDELTAGLDLDALVLFSSGAAAWGGAGQGAYAAANAYLDALAAHRRGRGLKATSVAWGSWAEAGMLVNAGGEHRDRLDALGVIPMPPDLAIAALQRIMHDDETTIVVANMDWTRFAPVFTAARPSPLLSELVEPDRSSADGSDGAYGADGLVRRLAGLSPDEREQALIELVRESTAAVLGHSSNTDIGTDRPFKDLGFDSLTAIELRNLLQTRTGVTLAASAVFDHPDPQSLANKLAALLPEPDASNGAAVPATAPRPDLFGELYLRAMEDGRLRAAQELMLSGARLRPMFHDPAELAVKPSLVRMTPARPGPQVICVCPTVMTTGPQVYTRFAEHLAAADTAAGIGTVSALVPPGFTADDALPATRDCLVRSLADATEEHVGESEFLLIGHSSGGAVGYEVAKELQSRGHAPAAMVLMDAYSFDTDGGLVEKVFREELNARMIEYLRLAGVDRLSERITAQVWSLELLRGWRPEGLTVPTLYLRPVQRLVDEEKPEWRSDVLAAMSTIIDVRGDHFTILEADHVATTAETIDAWLNTL
jgi:acyl transferase domain-containing protein/thioesterase domain-containing protein